MFTVMIKPLKHNETSFLNNFFKIIPAMGHYRHVYYSICDSKKENLQIHHSPYPLMYFFHLLMK